MAEAVTCSQTVPLGPVDGVSPELFVFPEQIGRMTVDFLREAVESRSEGNGRRLFIVKHSRDQIYRVHVENRSITKIESFNMFEDPRVLVDGGIDDEENTQLVIRRLSELNPRTIHNYSHLRLPTDLGEYTVRRLPHDGLLAEKSNVVFFCIASRSPNYFDLASSNFDDGSNSYYSSSGNANSSGRHSGDIHTSFSSENGQFLLHSIQSSSMRHKSFLWVSGYQNTKLIKFKDNRPTLMCVNTSEKAIYYVPVRLDEASAGENIGCYVLSCVVDESQIHIQPMNGPYIMNDVSRFPHRSPL